MATYRAFANRPWHTESNFENLTRILVGATSTDDISTTVWSECRANAESDIMLALQDSDRPVRTMLNRIPGELIPQVGKITFDGSFSYTMMLPDVITTPAIRLPRVWRNLAGAWEDRFDYDPLELGTDYTLSGNTVTILAASKGDVYCIEYEHTMNPVPDALRYLSLNMTMHHLIISKYGTDQEQVQQWAEQYGGRATRQIELLQEGRMDIPEFARINLYADWTEGKDSIRSLQLARV